MLWCIVHLYYTTLLNKALTQVLRIADGFKFQIRTKVFNIFRLLENKTLEMFSMRERRKSKHKLSGTKVCKAKQVSKYSVNPKSENEVFGQCVNYIICCLDFRNTKAFVRKCSEEQVF